MIVFNAGEALVLVLGVWLAIYVDGYALLGSWILSALVLWVVSGYAGARSTAAYGEARAFAGRLASQGADAPSAGLRELVHSRRALLLHAANAAAVLAILVLMVLKPGAS